MTTYKIILAKNQHIQFFPEIEKAAAQIFSDEDLDPAHKSIVTSIEEFKEGLKEKRLWSVLSSSANVVGFLLADIIDGNFHIKEMDIHPDHGRQGLGAKLLKAAIEDANAKAFNKITLTTFGHLKWNRMFYQKHGFSVVTKVNKGTQLSRILEDEAKQGLKNRVAMKLDLASAL